MTDTRVIKDRLDIVQLIGEYVQLKKAGTNWKGRCPFHNEKTPSFMVQRDKQFWHCFGCGKGGDVFSFVQEIEGLDFVGSLKLLADKAGVQLDTVLAPNDNGERTRALKVLEAAAEFYHRFLVELPAAKAAREYLAKRNLTSTTINEWQIGFVPDQWDLLTKYLMKKGFGVDDLVAAGLTIMREGANPQSGRGYYDRFRGRIMFPICDAHGTVIGFTGRVLVETADSGGKYVNTPQTSVYDKSRVLFGLSKAKTEIKNKNLTVLVEGQMDVIACHQAGMKNVVAASGTALTIDQVRLMKRYSENMAMAFDADSAGENAGKRGIAVALGEGMSVKVIQLPPNAGKDAAEVIGKNPAVWQQAVAEARGVMDWFFDRAFAGKNLRDPSVKRAIGADLLARIADISYSIEREHWLQILSERLDVDVGVLRDEIKNAKKPTMVTPSTNNKSAPAEKPADPPLVETEWWSLIIKFPVLYKIFYPKMLAQYFAGSPYEMLYEKAKDLYTSLGELDTNALRQSYDTGGENMIDILLLRPYRDRDEMTQAEAESELTMLLARLQSGYAKRRGKQIERELTEAESKGDKDLAAALVQELLTLQSHG